MVFLLISLIYTFHTAQYEKKNILVIVFLPRAKMQQREITLQMVDP